MVNILVLGGGGREAAITDHLQFNDSHTVFRLNKWDNDLLELFCQEKNIELVVPTSEEYLCRGIVDYFAEHAPDISVFGPNKEQARIEGSKLYSKRVMSELGIQTPNYRYYSSSRELTQTHPRDLFKYTLVDLFEHTPVVKYSGLAKGKGVFTSPILQDVYPNMLKAFDLGDEGVLLEERISGREVSVLAFCNGSEAFLMPQVQDYKKMYDDDCDVGNPNTGGMGAVCPANILSDEELELVKKQMNKVVDRLHYKGVLYAGLVKSQFGGVYFLEFNCRFGDPETQVLINLLESNLYDIMMDCLRERRPTVKWSHQHAAAVVLSHVTYPASALNEPVKMTYGDIDSSVVIYKAGAIDVDGETYTKGGRVLAMVSKADELQTALENIYNNIHKIQYDGAYYRRDVGSNLIKEDTRRKVAVGVLASGNGTSAGRLLEERSGFVKVIITDREDARVIEKAKHYHIPFVLIHRDGSPRDYYEKIVNILRTFDVELVILSGFMRIVPATLFGEFFTVNIHPSLLPKYGGMMDMDIHNAVIESRDLFSGCTLHRVTKDVDKGRILMQKQYRLERCEDGESLKKAVQRLEGDCVLEYIDIYSRSKISYGVNVQEGNEFVNGLKKILPKVGGFCSDIWTSDRGTLLVATTDGAGTKLDLSIKYNKLDTIGIDLVAMNVNDLIAGGAEPIIFMDYIALDRMDKTKCDTIIRGIQRGCQIAGCELAGGETAEMKGIYMKNKLDLAGFAVGEIRRQLSGKEFMTEDNILYGVESSGIHSNGYTLVNKLLERCHPQDCPSVDELLRPTRIYSDVYELWTSKHDGPSILKMAHITGGGFRDNLPRILPDHLTYELTDWEFPDIFKWIQKESKLSREEMLATFNCGYGMVIVAEKEMESPMLTYIGRLVNKST